MSTNGWRPTSCWRCALHTPLCICPQIAPVHTRCEVHVIRHWKERMRMTNSVRLAGLVLPELRVHRYGDAACPLDLSWLDSSRGVLVYPSGQGDSMTARVSEARAEPPSRPPLQVVLIDGSWTQAQKMRTRLGPISRLPRLSFSVDPELTSRPRLRRGPRSWTLSTAEALARALETVGETGPSRAVDDAFRHFVDGMRRQRGWPPPPSNSESLSR